MRILIFSNSFDMNNSSGSGRLNDLVDYLVSIGHEPHVLTSTFDYLTGQIESKYKKRLVTTESENGYSVCKTWTYDGYNKSYFHRFISFLSFLFSSVYGQFFVGKYDVVFVGTPPFFLGIPGIIAAKRKKVPFIYEVRDLWIDVAIELGFLRNRMLINIMKKFEAYFFKKAKMIVTNSPAFGQKIEKTGIMRDKIIFIPNGVNLKQFSPTKGNSHEIRKRLGLEGKFMVIYTGAHGLANNLDYILNAAKIIKESDDSIRFLFIGDGNYKKKMMHRAKSENIDNVIFHDPVNKSNLSDFIIASDFGIATLLPTQVLKTTYPNKVFDYMACGIPVIVAIDGVIRELVVENRAGVYVDPNCPEALANIIVKLKAEPEKRKSMGENGLNLVRQQFDRKKITKNLADIIVNADS